MNKTVANDQKIKLKVLLMDNSEQELYNVFLELKKNYELDSKVVNSDIEFEKMINEDVWDIVISDYSGNKFNSAKALIILKRKGIDIPFIVISGNNGEETAVEIMKAGAADYIMKNNLARFLPAVERELRDANFRRERRLAKEILLKKEKQYRNLVETMNDGLMQVDNDDIIQFVNNRFCKILGYSSEELIGKVAYKTLIPKDEWEIILSKKELRKKGVSDRYEIRMKKKSGEIIWTQISGSPVTDENGNCIGPIDVISDINDKKNAMVALEETKKKFKNLADLLPQSVFECDLSGNITFANQAVYNTFCYSKNEVKNHFNIFQVLSEKDRPKAKIDFLNLMNGTSSRDREYTAKKIDGTIFPCLVYANVIINDGRINGIRGLLVDISSQKRIQEELLESKENAEEANRIKTSLISSISHEIRTPLNAILGINQLLKDEFFTIAGNEIKELFYSMEDAGHRLLNTITQILDISRIEANQFDVKIEPIVLQRALKTNINILKSLAEEKNIGFSFTLPGRELLVAADEYCLNGVLLNIISNSIKYSNFGIISLKVIENCEKIYLEIADNGIGMSEEYQKHLFQIFSQEDIGNSRRYEGTWLGLAITKRYLDLMKGDIKIKSKKGEGTITVIGLPKVFQN